MQDLTGLKGTYAIDLSWGPDHGHRPDVALFRGHRSSFGRRGADLPAAPTANIFTAIRDSLGLRLEPRNEQVEMLVTGHVSGSQSRTDPSRSSDARPAPKAQTSPRVVLLDVVPD